MTTESKRLTKPLGNVGRYVLRAELASGGMAAVYLAELHGPHGFEKTVAVKRIHPHLAKDRRFVEMFLDEARLAARIHHPNVCAIVDFGEEEGAPYLVMEYLAGEPLSAVMKRIRSLDETPFWLPSRIVHDAALGLHAAHRLRGSDGSPVGVVHRDVSPQNVFVLFDGVTKVVDFGVARARGRLTTTRTNEIKGKLGYMSPEQLDQLGVDQRTDVWALGVVLWEATVGRRLFRAENEGATLNLVLHKPIPRPSEHREDYPERLEAIVMRCLERDPSARYATAEALASDLEEYLYSTGKPAGQSQVRKWMEAHFEDRIGQQEMRLRDGSAAPFAEEDTGSTRSVLRERKAAEDDDRPTTLHEGGRDAATVLARPMRRTRATARFQPFAWMAGGALIVLALVYARGLREVDPIAPPAGAPPAATAPAPDIPLAAPSPSVTAQQAEPEAETGVSPARGPADADEPMGSPEGSRRTSSPRPRRVEQAPAAQAASTEPGRLSLIAIPAATARLGARTLGVTPLVNLPLPPGVHRLDLRSESGRTKSVTVRVRSGETTRMRVEL